MRALYWDQVCPGSKQRIHFPFTLSRAEGVSCVGAGRLLLLLLPWLFLFAVSLPPLGLPLPQCLPLPAGPPRAAPFENRAWPTFLPFDAGRRKCRCRMMLSISAQVTSSRYKIVRYSLFVGVMMILLQLFATVFTTPRDASTPTILTIRLKHLMGSSIT